ncbi:hypothetical protein EVJ58_g10136, partial [Rhodofomes roseus]
NYGQLYHRQGWDFHRRLWAEYGSVVKVHAAFGTECLYVYDPATLNCLLSDATAVEQSGFIAATYRLLLGPGLMSARGDHHRRQRKTLNPVFSPRNLKEMLPVIYGVIHKLRDAMSAQLPTGTKELDMLQWTNRGALEVMGQAGLGYSFTALGENPSNDFARALKGLLYVLPFPHRIPAHHASQPSDAARRLPPHAYPILHQARPAHISPPARGARGAALEVRARPARGRQHARPEVEMLEGFFENPLCVVVIVGIVMCSAFGPSHLVVEEGVAELTDPFHACLHLPDEPADLQGAKFYVLEVILAVAIARLHFRAPVRAWPMADMRVIDVAQAGKHYLLVEFH